jgi:hypothetical protein
MIEFSPKQKEIIRAPFDYTLEVNEGTPRSGKTTAGHFRFAYYLTVTPDENHLIVAYNQEQSYRRESWKEISQSENRIAHDGRTRRSGRY